MKYQFIQQQSLEFPIEKLCSVMQLSRSSYYDFNNNISYQISTDAKHQMDQIKQVFDNHKGRYGSRRIKKELESKNELKIGRRKISRILKVQNLKAIQPKSFVPKTTDSKQTKKPAPNLLKGIETISRPGEVWVGDITYIGLETAEWAYLASWIDIYHHKVVGWEVQNHMRAELIIQAFVKAKIRCGTSIYGLIVHSDQGGQYNSKEFKKMLKDNSCKQSMTSQGEVYDNAIAESFFARLKCELIHQRKFNSLEELRSSLFEYIDGYYNTIRPHSSLGYKAPSEFEKMYYQKIKQNDKAIG